VSLLTELDAFFTEHRACGELDAGVEDEVVWIACDCGASIGASSGRGRASHRRLNWTPKASPLLLRGALDLSRRPPHHPGWTAAASC
jgi:hypothetical protein